MPNKIRIITNGVSDGARSLGEALTTLGVNVSRVRVSNGPKRPQRLNIKWGCFTIDPNDFFGGPFINGTASDVSLNKLTCFQRLENEGVPVPTFTTHRETAHVWLQEGCRRIYERHVLRGSEGEGIRIVEATAEGEIQGEGLTDAPLYVKGMHGVRREYRIHVFQKEGVRRVFVQQKRRRTTDVEETTNESRIRNLANGWIFAHNDIVTPRTQTIDAAVGAIVALGLNFGGVDLIEMDDVTKGSVVLEINCAPGLQGGTLDFYAHAIKAVLDGVVDEVPQEENIGPPEDDDEDYAEEDDDDY